MTDLARLGQALVDTTKTAEAHGCLPRALAAITPMAFVGLMFAGRELLLLALDEEMNHACWNHNQG